MGEDVEEQSDRRSAEPQDQSHIDLRGQVVAISAVSMGPQGEDLGLLLRGQNGSIAVILDREQEVDLFAQVYAEHRDRAQRLALCPGAED